MKRTITLFCAPVLRGVLPKSAMVEIGLARMAKATMLHNMSKSQAYPVVFLPGLLSDEALFSGQISALSPFFKVSSYPALGANNIEAIAARILKSAPPHFVAAGLSMGGYVAFELLRQAPARVRGLVLMNTSARADTPEQLEKRAALIHLAQMGRFKGVTPRLLPLLINEKHIHDEAITSVIFAMAERVGRDNFVAQQQAIMARVDSRALLPQINIPTLVIGGADDAITPPALQQEIAASIKGAQLHMLDDCGHLSSLEQTDGVTGLISDFMANLTQPSP